MNCKDLDLEVGIRPDSKVVLKTQVIGVDILFEGILVSHVHQLFPIQLQA